MARLDGIPIISQQQVAASVRLEFVAALLLLSLGAWVFYKLFLRRASADRHRIFRAHFANLANHLSIGLVIYGIYEAIDQFGGGSFFYRKLGTYIGLLAIIWGCVVFVKILRIAAFEFLFRTSMKAGVPLLLVNIFTLIVSLVLLAWFVTAVFGLQLAPLLATSAVLSVVLGLALQDTLGNLFSAIALQFDKPFDLDDWIEVKVGSEKISGQVHEITWRSTTLTALTEEAIVLPNRILAQSQISNFSTERAFIRSQIFRIPFDADLAKAKKVLVDASYSVPGVARFPAPVVIATETTDSWIQLKAVYYILDYGAQFGITDRYLDSALKHLKDAGISLASPRLSIDKRDLAS